jgi:hypothetical protein
MKIELHEITVRDVCDGYKNSAEEGVVGFHGHLNIRPKYQREFVYKDEPRNAVIKTLRKDFPLNTMYWIKNQDGTFEVLDGQQRTISICEYVAGSYSIDFRYFHNLEQPEMQQILNYKLMVYICEGDDKEKLEWFRTVNIAGEKLTEQELRNSTYTGEWLTAAKRYFSKTQGPAYQIGKEYMRGTPNRQEYLETVLDWISKGNIEQYMAEHQHKPNANELVLYYQSVIAWVKATFPNYRKEMNGVNFGELYDMYHTVELNTVEIEALIATLMRDEDVTKKSGIYKYVLTKDPRALNIRPFSQNQKRESYERQNGVCPKCEQNFDIDKMEADHITPWSVGGKTTADNCQMLCKDCNRRKSNV